MVDSAFGLVPVKKAGESGVQGAKNNYYIDSNSASYATAIYIGDPVTKRGSSNTGRIGQSGHVMGFSGRGAGELPDVVISTVGDTYAITGAVVGVAGNPANPGITYRAASTVAVLEVADDPDLEFEAMVNTTFAATQVGLNAVLVAGTGDPVTGQSGYMVEGTATDVPAADASNQLLILRVSNDMRRGLSATYPVVVVKITNHTERFQETLGIA